MRQMAPSLDNLRQQLLRASPTQLSVGFGVLSFVIILVGTCAAYSEDRPLPAPREAPPPPEKATVTSYRYKETFYHAVIDEDCAKFGIPKMSLEQMKAVYPHRVEFDGAQRLRVGQKLSTKSLEMKAVKMRLWVGPEGKSIRAPHFVLQITNRTNKHLAYRVATRSERSSKGKGVLAHNALALSPGQTVERTECMLRGSRVVVERVEVMDLSPLGYYYVSRLHPKPLQRDPRSSAGHDYGGQEPCKMIPWRRIRRELQVEDAHWFDMIDFYARHNCDEYIYHSGYRRPTQPLEKLPVKGTKGQP
jgi:hypothetical protein